MIMVYNKKVMYLVDTHSFSVRGSRNHFLKGAHRQSLLQHEHAYGYVQRHVL